METREEFSHWSASYMNEMLEAAHALTGAGVCLYDPMGYIFGQDASARNAQASFRHECAFCRAVQALPGGRAACIYSDVVRGEAMALSGRGPVPHTCHAGLTEVVVPLIAGGDRLIGAVFIGQCAQGASADIEERLEHFQRPLGDIAQKYRALPVVPLEALKRAGALLFGALCNYAEKLERFERAHFLPQSEMTHAQRALSYIEDNYHRPISTLDVARDMHLTPAYLARVFKRQTGMNVTEYIAHRRATKALEYLRGGDTPIGSIAVNLGFPDQNYFSRWFRKIMGDSPSAYRKTRLDGEITPRG